MEPPSFGRAVNIDGILRASTTFVKVFSKFALSALPHPESLVMAGDTDGNCKAREQ